VPERPAPVRRCRRLFQESRDAGVMLVPAVTGACPPAAAPATQGGVL
jgi:hypothetical protein